MAIVTITDIKPTKRGRFSIFTNGEYALSVDDETLVKNGLKVGLTLEITQLMDINTQSEFQKAKKKAYDIISYRDHSEKELFDKLNKTFAEEISAMAVEYLVEIGYLNDSRFARLYLRHLQNKGTFSKKSMEYELKKKGIDPYIMEECLEEVEVDDSETVKELVLKKYRRKLQGGDTESVQKVKQAVARRGFHYEAVSVGVRKALEELGLESF